MNNDLLKLEAVLFAYGKLVPENEIKSLLNKKNIQPLLNSLKEKYANEETSLNLIQQDNKWKLTVKDSYLDLVKGIVTKTELDRPTMETLAVIAFKYPVLQSEVISVRNAAAYDHIKNLVESGYVIKEKFGRSYKLKLTQKFFDYFDLPEDKLKELFSDFKEIEKEIVEQEGKALEVKKKVEEQKDIMKKKDENQQLDTITKKDVEEVVLSVNPEPHPNPEPDPSPEPPLPEPNPIPETE